MNVTAAELDAIAAFRVLKPGVCPASGFQANVLEQQGFMVTATLLSTCVCVVPCL